jgi:hypothetical protein
MMPEFVMLACGMVEDGNRILFLTRKNRIGTEYFELPYALLVRGDNPVAVLTKAFLLQTGIDAQVHEIIYQAKHNIGSRKRKKFIPAVAFKVTSKSNRVSLSKEFSGFKWVPRDEVGKLKLARQAEWLWHT